MSEDLYVTIILSLVILLVTYLIYRQDGFRDFSEHAFAFLQDLVKHIWKLVRIVAVLIGLCAAPIPTLVALVCYAAFSVIHCESKSNKD